MRECRHCTAAGSSPLARGLPRRPPEPPDRRRIIPARAGFTPGRAAPSSASPDHPRSRGVYPRTETPVWSAEGSSPLARGLPVVHVDDRACQRIIPARAGFTDLWGPDKPAILDHPRSRGVYQNDFDVELPQVGSSPLARGLRREGLQEGVSREDHPRSRGVYTPPRPTDPSEAGSSPLARGLRQVEVDRVRGQGIIPARAGFTTLREVWPWQ